MAQIKTLTYSRTINLGNYESERLEATVELESKGHFSDGREDTEDANGAFRELKEWVLQQIYAPAKTIRIPDPDNYGKFIEERLPDPSPTEDLP